MTVFNKTNKIIGIGGEPVLPFGFATVPDSCKNNSAVQRLADEGRIVINPSERAAQPAASPVMDVPPEPAAPPLPEAEPSPEPSPEPVPTEIPEATEKAEASPADKKRASKS